MLAQPRELCILCLQPAAQRSHLGLQQTALGQRVAAPAGLALFGTQRFGLQRRKLRTQHVTRHRLVPLQRDAFVLQQVQVLQHANAQRLVARAVRQRGPQGGGGIAIGQRMRPQPSQGIGIGRGAELPPLCGEAALQVTLQRQRHLVPGRALLGHRDMQLKVGEGRASAEQHIGQPPQFGRSPAAADDRSVAVLRQLPQHAARRRRHSAALHAHACSAASARRRLALPGLSTKTQRLPRRLQWSLTRQYAS